MRELCPWYALTVKRQQEAAAQAALEFKGFEALAPIYRARHIAHGISRTAYG